MAPLPMLSHLRSFVLIQETGLVLVVLLMGAYLAWKGGTVTRPVMERGPEGYWQVAMTTGADGQPERKTETVNKFLNAQNLSTLAKQTSFIAIMAVGMAIVIISGGIDLSVGSIYAAAAVAGALVLHYFGPGGSGNDVSAWLSLPLGALACVGAGALCGLLNGGLIVALRVHPFIVTLGTMSILRGVAFKATDGQSVGEFPPQLQALVNVEIGDRITLVPLGVMLAATLLGWIFLSRLAAGRRVYAVGGNELAARYSGINVGRVKLSVYFLAGLATGVAALLALGCYGSASSGDGASYELKAIAAAVVGGTSLSGGRGSALGAVLGALIVQMIDSGIVILELKQSNSQIIIGSVVIAAVVLDQVNAWLVRRRLARRAA